MFERSSEKGGMSVPIKNEFGAGRRIQELVPMLQLQASKPYPILLLPWHVFGAPEYLIYLQESVFSSPALIQT